MRLTKRTLIFASATLFSVFAMTAPAFAHVSVTPDSLPKGSDGTLTFQVPNEESSASTTRFEIDLPTDHPITSVDVQPIPGWTYTVTKTSLPTPVKTETGQVSEVVTKVEWQGGNIKPGEFEQYNIALGPLPTDTDALAIKAIQTYSNGDVVRWIDAPTTNGQESEHPAPVVDLTAADATPTPIKAVVKDDDNTVETLSIIGVSIAVIALLVGVAALVKARKH